MELGMGRTKRLQVTSSSHSSHHRHFDRWTEVEDDVQEQQQRFAQQWQVAPQVRVSLRHQRLNEWRPPRGWWSPTPPTLPQRWQEAEGGASRLPPSMAVSGPGFKGSLMFIRSTLRSYSSALIFQVTDVVTFVKSIGWAVSNQTKPLARNHHAQWMLLNSTRPIRTIHNNKVPHKQRSRWPPPFSVHFIPFDRHHLHHHYTEHCWWITRNPSVDLIIKSNSNRLSK